MRHNKSSIICGGKDTCATLVGSGHDITPVGMDLSRLCPYLVPPSASDSVTAYEGVQSRNSAYFVRCVLAQLRRDDAWIQRGRRKRRILSELAKAFLAGLTIRLASAGF